MNTKGLNSTKKYGRYWIRTSDPFRVKEVRYHCANRPRQPLYKLRFQLDYELRLGLNR